MKKLKTKIIVQSPNGKQISIQKYVNGIKKIFRNLDDWKVKFIDDKKDFGQVRINLETKIAEIYSYHPKKTFPQDYFFHEIIHIAIKTIMIEGNIEKRREKEEMFVQDLCDLIFINAK